jgi:hypothetical protein
MASFNLVTAGSNMPLPTGRSSIKENAAAPRFTQIHFPTK